MKKMILIFFVSCLMIGCNQMTPEEKIENLNGYWEIKSVEPTEGNPTEFKFNEMVDYISVEDKIGYRTKVRPQLDGSFITTENSEILTVKIENDSINLYYETPYDSWKETLLSSEEDKIKLLNRNGTVYTYQRFSPYLIEDYGTEN